MLKKLISIANHLDKLGQHDLADELDQIIKSAAASPSGVISALKKDDPELAIKALEGFLSAVPSFSSPAQEMELSRIKFRELAGAIKSRDLEKARQILGVKIITRDWENPDPDVYNPLTGLPWGTPIEKKEPQEQGRYDVKKQYEISSGQKIVPADLLNFVLISSDVNIPAADVFFSFEKRNGVSFHARFTTEPWFHFEALKESFSKNGFYVSGGRRAISNFDEFYAQLPEYGVTKSLLANLTVTHDYGEILVEGYVKACPAGANFIKSHILGK